MTVSRPLWRVLCSGAPRSVVRRPGWPTQRWLSSSSSSTSTAAASSPPALEPLRILFCGSDAFSCASLQALHREMVRQRAAAAGTTSTTGTTDAVGPGRIASLEVVVRPAKRVGRGRKAVADNPVQQLAAALGLPVYERDTFTGWAPPRGDDGSDDGSSSSLPPAVNLIVAVSFGLFVPRRLLRAARYGGLNVHPSLLPDLAGAAPIEHAVLRGRAATGVTVQTLDETAFDGGRRLLQGPPPRGLPIPPGCTAADLHRRLAPLGADLLVEALRRGLYLLPASGVAAAVPDLLPAEAIHTPPQRAPKLTKADRQVPWRGVAPADAAAAAAAATVSADIDRRARALGPLWTHLAGRRRGQGVDGGSQPAAKRAILDDLGLVACPAALQAALQDGSTSSSSSSHPLDVPTVTFLQQDDRGQLHPVTLPFAVDGESVVVPVGCMGGGADEAAAGCLRIGQIKLEGDRAKPAARVAQAVADAATPADRVSWDVACGR